MPTRGRNTAWRRRGRPLASRLLITVAILARATPRHPTPPHTRWRTIIADESTLPSLCYSYSLHGDTSLAKSQRLQLSMRSFEVSMPPVCVKSVIPYPTTNRTLYESQYLTMNRTLKRKIMIFEKGLRGRQLNYIIVMSILLACLLTLLRFTVGCRRNGQQAVRFPGCGYVCRNPR